MAISYNPGGSVNVAATTSSVAGTIAMGIYPCIRISNTSATVHVGVRFGVGAQTAVLTTDLVLEPMSSVIVSAPRTTTGVAAIGSAGTTTVNFTPCSEG